MAESFIWGAGGARMTPERIAAERKIAQAMMERGMDYSPVEHWTQGAARVAQAISGGMDLRNLSAAERANMAAERDMVKGWLTPQAPAAAAPVAASPAAVSGTAAPSGPTPVVMGQAGPAAMVEPGVFDENAVMMPPGSTPNYRDAIASIESAGSKNPYGVLGPVTDKGDRAHGRYQVMGQNIGPWTEAALGRRLTPQQFLGSPEAQDRVFDHRFGGYVQKSTAPDAASMWFSGRPLAGNTSRDQLGTSVPTYVQKFSKYLGNQPAAPAEEAALPPNATPTQGFAVPGQPAPAAAPVAAPAAPQSNLNPALLQAIISPYTSEGTKKVAQIMLQNQLQADGVTTIDLGNEVGIMDKRGNVVRRLPKGEPNKGPEFGVIRKDEDGREEYGWRNPRDQSVTPYRPQQAATPAVDGVTGPDGKIIPYPPGVDRKKFKQEVTGATADAATGKKTEVQAKSEKFGNKMELAERNVRDIETEGQSLSGRGLEYVPLGNLLQGEKYQKFKQARDNFITALLRDESGAAIGTPEFVRYERELFPQPGDGKAVIEQKREARRVAIEAMKKAAGPGYKSPDLGGGGNKTASGVTWSVE